MGTINRSKEIYNPIIDEIFIKLESEKMEFLKTNKEAEKII